MGQQVKVKKKAKGFGTKDTLTISFGAMVSGDSVNMTNKGSLLEFTATKRKHSISGYVRLFLSGKTGELSVEWIVTSTGDTPKDIAKAILTECYQKRHKKEVYSAFKRRRRGMVG